MKSNYQVHMSTPSPLYGNVLSRVHLAMKSNYHMGMKSFVSNLLTAYSPVLYLKIKKIDQNHM